MEETLVWRPFRGSVPVPGRYLVQYRCGATGCPTLHLDVLEAVQTGHGRVWRGLPPASPFDGVLRIQILWLAEVAGPPPAHDPVPTTRISYAHDRSPALGVDDVLRALGLDPGTPPKP